MSASAILCPFGGVRLSTALALSAFVTLAIGRRERGPLIAGVAWLLGFEAVFQATALAVGHPLVLGRAWALLWLVIGSAAVLWATWRGHQPSWPLLVATAAVWIAWVATGFHTNFHELHATSLDPLAEALNEGAKTLAALAYLIPLVADRREPSRLSLVAPRPSRSAIPRYRGKLF